MTTKYQTKVDLHIYVTSPQHSKAAIETVDWLDLAHQFVRANMEVPIEVQDGCDSQLREVTPQGYQSYVEPYMGRMRVVMFKGRRLPWEE